MAIEVLDTTLRDGAQNTDISYSLQDKRDIAALLAELKLTFIEVGFPAVSEVDASLVSSLPSLGESHGVAFGSTAKKGVEPEDDGMLVSLVSSPIEYVSLVGKSSAFQVENVLETTLDENLKMIGKSVAYATKKGKNVIFCAEHFFDGARENYGYAVKALEAAIEGGAKRIVLCDTNGASFPEEIEEVVKKVVLRFGKRAIIGIHAHNDGGLAVANTLAAVKAGASHIQGTLLGIGERCGNAALTTVLPLLAISKRMRIFPEPELKKLTMVARAVASVGNISVPDNMPFVGRSAYAHKAGMHADGMLKTTSSFEDVCPAEVGNQRRLILSEASGSHLVWSKLLPYFPYLTRDGESLKRIIAKMKERATEGASIEGAEGSFYIMASEVLCPENPCFEVASYSAEVTSEGGCRATIHVLSKGAEESATAEGVGPVHALDIAMRKCLVSIYPPLSKVSLKDYKVRVINPKSATGATVRVLISTSDGERVWRTMGVSPDIIEASVKALAEGYKYPLLFPNIDK